MRTEMTANAFGKDAWDKGGALPPEEVIPKIREFVESRGVESTGEFWAPNGPA